MGYTLSLRLKFNPKPNVVFRKRHFRSHESSSIHDSEHSIFSEHRKELRLGAHQKIVGYIITRFYEPHVKVPHGFTIITTAELNHIFGESRNKKIYDMSLTLKISKEAAEEMVKRQLMETVAKDPSLERHNLYSFEGYCKIELERTAVVERVFGW